LWQRAYRNSLLHLGHAKDLDIERAQLELPVKRRAGMPNVTFKPPKEHDKT